jgi:hypothetical protein
MNAIRTFQMPVNGALTVIVPEEFRNTMCEIIVLPSVQNEVSGVHTTKPINEILSAFTGTAKYPQTVLGETDMYEQ